MCQLSLEFLELNDPLAVSIERVEIGHHLLNKISTVSCGGQCRHTARRTFIEQERAV